MQPVDQHSFLGLLWGMSLFTLGTASAGVFYMASQKARHRSMWETLLQMPLLMSIGIGIALNNARGVIEALVGHESPFVRTPKKYSTRANARGWRSKVLRHARAHPGARKR